MNLEQLWEKLNESRIKLEANDQGASLKFGADRARYVRGPEDGARKSLCRFPAETPESIARSLARLERMVEQASAVADQVSEAGTLVGKAMIALNESMDSRSRSAKVEAVTKSEQIVAVPVAVTATPVVNAIATSPTEVIQNDSRDQL